MCSEYAMITQASEYIAKNCKKFWTKNLRTKKIRAFFDLIFDLMVGGKKIQQEKWKKKWIPFFIKYVSILISASTDPHLESPYCQLPP